MINIRVRLCLCTNVLLPYEFHKNEIMSSYLWKKIKLLYPRKSCKDQNTKKYKNEI